MRYTVKMTRTQVDDLVTLLTVILSGPVMEMLAFSEMITLHNAYLKLQRKRQALLFKLKGKYYTISFIPAEGDVISKSVKAANSIGIDRNWSPLMVITVYEIIQAVDQQSKSLRESWLSQVRSNYEYR